MLITWAPYDTNLHPAAFQMSRTTTSCAQTHLWETFTLKTPSFADELHLELHLAEIITRYTGKLVLIRRFLIAEAGKRFITLAVLFVTG